jgi:hypothetical protein
MNRGKGRDAAACRCSWSTVVNWVPAVCVWWRVVWLFNSSAAPRRSERQARPPQSQTNLANVFSSGPLASTSWRSVRTHRLLCSSYGRPPVRSALRYQTCCCNMKGLYFLVVLCAVVCTGRNMWPSLVDRYVHRGTPLTLAYFSTQSYVYMWTTAYCNGASIDNYVTKFLT